jgi:redox-sensitive bicupin YhaK (pirin superfamily)
VIKIRRAQDRGQANHGWLKSAHTFSFADYFDPQFMGFGNLRVINEDYVAANSGFPTHGHKDMEIVTYVTEGILEHKDTLGNSEQIKPGELQRMSAGTGIRHSEYNPSTNQTTRLFQIWILPDKPNYPPSYEQKDFSAEFAKESIKLVVSNDGRLGSLKINQNVDLYIGKSSKIDYKFEIQKNRKIWLQMIAGTLSVNDVLVTESDALAIESEALLHLKSDQPNEFMLFDL